MSGKMKREEELRLALSFGMDYGSLISFFDTARKVYEEGGFGTAKGFYKELPKHKPDLVKHAVISFKGLIEEYEGLPEKVKELLGDRFHKDIKRIMDANPKDSEIYKVIWEYLSEDTRYPYIV